MAATGFTRLSKSDPAGLFVSGQQQVRCSFAEPVFFIGPLGSTVQICAPGESICRRRGQPAFLCAVAAGVAMAHERMTLERMTRSEMTRSGGFFS
jgi:hypothetical protein